MQTLLTEVCKGEERCTHWHVNCEEELQELVSCYISPNIYVSGQIFICHWIYDLSASAANNFLWTVLHRIRAENFTLAAHEPWQTSRTLRKPPVLKKNCARSTGFLQSPKGSLLSTSSALQSVLYIDWNELSETRGWAAKHRNRIQQERTHQRCEQRAGVRRQEEKDCPKGQLPWKRHAFVTNMPTKYTNIEIEQ